jgi:hypothetical protein
MKKELKADKIINPKTGRPVKRDGKIGKQVLEDMKKLSLTKAKSPSPKINNLEKLDANTFSMIMKNLDILTLFKLELALPKHLQLVYKENLNKKQIFNSLIDYLAQFNKQFYGATNLNRLTLKFEVKDRKNAYSLLFSNNHDDVPKSMNGHPFTFQYHENAKFSCSYSIDDENKVKHLLSKGFDPKAVSSKHISGGIRLSKSTDNDKDKIEYIKSLGALVINYLQETNNYPSAMTNLTDKQLSDADILIKKKKIPILSIDNILSIKTELSGFVYKGLNQKEEKATTKEDLEEYKKQQAVLDGVIRKVNHYIKSLPQ